MKLFVIYVGGKTPTSLIEVHDIHFAIGETIEDTYDQIRDQWWGTSKSLHLDAWGALTSVENYNVLLKSKPSANDINNLYFINLGGYDPNEFSELHKNIFVIAKSEDEAKHKAKATISNWTVPHKDNLYTVEDCVNVNKILLQKGLSIHLEYTNDPQPFQFTCKYVPIGLHQ